MRLLLIIFLIPLLQPISAQEYGWTYTPIDKSISLRGLWAVTDNVVWASGSDGRVFRSIDSGINWIDRSLRGFEKYDFRDIHAWDSLHAIIMSIAAPSYLLKTKDGGKQWNIVFFDTGASMFLDAMDFNQKGEGIVIGDPQGDIPFIATTSNYGDTWSTNIKNKLMLNPGEAFFAASGSNIKFLKPGHYHAVTGGEFSRLLRNNRAYPMPVIQGKVMTGANSIATRKYLLAKHIAIVAGDYERPALQDSNFLFSKNNGSTWHFSKNPPGGYRSSIIFFGKNKLVCSGITGVDITSDGGRNWHSISTKGFNACAHAKGGRYIFFAGKGHIGRYCIP